MSERRLYCLALLKTKLQFWCRRFFKLKESIMNIMKELLPPKIYENIDRAGICTLKQLVTLSIWDIKKLTGIPTKQIELIRNTVAKHYSSPSVSCITLLNNKDDRLKSGCSSIDNLLNGGFRRGVLIEIYGESGSGKTQLGMQLLANNASTGGVYICTEDLFPIKRYNQIHNSINHCIQELSNNVFIEHVYETLDLLSCIKIRLPKLLLQHKTSLVIIDSVAAPFRSETSNYIQRAEDLRELAILLVKIAQENNLTVVCINQVTANFDKSSSKLLPSLGLAWSNMISYRFWLKKSNKEIPSEANKIQVRELKTVLAPDLPNASCSFLITSKGVTDL